MATIIPFKGICPARDKVHLVTSRSYDTYNAHTLEDKLKHNPYSFLHIIKPDFGIKKKLKPNSPEHLARVRAKYKSFIKQEYLIEDLEKSLYIYQQESHGHVYTGIMCCTSVEDYLKKVIKVHEQTLGQREEKLKEYLKVVDINAEPVCLTYPDDDRLDELIDEIKSKEAHFDFSTTDGFRHKLWTVDDYDTISNIVEQFGAMEALYIADGHHRSASSALLGKTKRTENPAAGDSAGFNFFLSILIPFSQLRVFEYNRLVKDLNGLSSTQFLSRVEQKFEVMKNGRKVYLPDEQHKFGMYLDGQWYELTIKPDLLKEDSPVESLDARILSQYILSPVLNISDLSSRKSTRVSFVGGIEKDMGKEIVEQVDSGKMKLAFTLFPATVEQIVSVADAEEVMPPKSTWIEPKFRSGMVVYDLSRI
ncbi:MAG: DUF1015 domain-containing protein [Flavobacteriales bacterium]|nr:DUF1015 domain-containing protein [Flavobacteriales bacterium]